MEYPRVPSQEEMDAYREKIQALIDQYDQASEISTTELHIAVAALARLTDVRLVITYNQSGDVRLEREDGSCPFGTKRRHPDALTDAIWFAVAAFSIHDANGGSDK